MTREEGIRHAICILKRHDVSASKEESISILNRILKETIEKKDYSLHSKYKITTQEEWLSIFIEQYNKHKPITSREYNSKKDKNTPFWGTIARNCGVTRWSELVKLANVPYHLRELDVKKEIYIVNSHAPLYDKLEELLLNKNTKK